MAALNEGVSLAEKLRLNWAVPYRSVVEIVGGGDTWADALHDMDELLDGCPDRSALEQRLAEWFPGVDPGLIVMQVVALSPVVPSVGAVPVEVPEEVAINELATALMDAWATAEPNHSITKHPVSYVATFVDLARIAYPLIAARVRAEERQRITPILLELHRIMEDAIVRGGYREGEAEQVERLMDSLAAGSAVPVTPDDSRFTNHAGAGHEFTFTVEMRGEGCNWSSTLVPVTVRAYNLRDAILQAAAVPFAQWFPAEEDTEQHPAPVATPAEPGRKCPDGGTCHHECVEDRKGCFRTHMCGPLSGVYPGDTWPPEVLAAEQDAQR